ncbi:MAG: hypothetical protein ACXWQR_01085 [Ktedonobacterales bacterium]
MQITAATPVREHERPMSWARAVLIATGFFFVTAILLGQIPSYFYTISTLSTLTRFEQGTLDLGLLAVGFGLVSLEISLLYDPKPLIPGFLFAGAGLVIAAVGGFFLYQVANGPQAGGWPEFLPSENFPTQGQSYLFHPAWFQAGSIDLTAVGMIALAIGLAMLSFAVLNRPVLTGRLAGPVRDLIVRFSLGLSIVIVALYLTLLTFVPAAVGGDKHPSAVGNILLFIALISAVFALQVWLLPVMVAHRARFMPAVYLHGVVGLLGFVGIPLLLLFVLAYPAVNLIHSVDSTQFWVECSQKTVIPGSCTFTPFTGYIICAIVFTLPFALLVAGLYFWSTRRDNIVLGGVYAMIYLGLAASVVHVDDPAQLPLGLIIAIGIAILAFGWVWATQREFATTQAEQLGCTGQWLVLGTLLVIYLAGFALFSMPNFFEIEALALFYVPGRGGLHDAFWGLLLMSGLAALQFTLLIRRRPMSTLRKFVLWTLLIAVALQMVGAIQGFHHDVLQEGIDAMEGGHAVFLAGICFEVVGFVAALIGALRAQAIRWAIAIVAVAAVSAAFGIVIYTLPQAYPELVVAAFIAASVGAFAYSVAGPDAPGEEVLAEANGNGRAPSSFVVTR